MSENEKNIEERIAYLEQKVLKLEEQNKVYENDQIKLFQTIRNLYEINQQAMESISKIVEDQGKLDIVQSIIGARCNNIRYELCDPKRKQYRYPIIKDREEALEEIIKNKKSIARFGDGEFGQIFGQDRQEFQKTDHKLGVRLKEVLYSRHPNLLVAIANNYGDLQEFMEHGADAIRCYLEVDDMRSQHLALLEEGRVYYDAYLSRPYVLYKDHNTDAPRKRFESLKEIWKGRDVVIVEGALTRMGVGNDLMDGAKEIKRILAPATSSFERYDDILKASLAHAKEDILFLIAMGPSAGVLAYDLTVEGYQALDIGHLDLEYEWFLAGEGKRTAVPYKYNNELEGDETALKLHDPVYEAQIVEDFS